MTDETTTQPQGTSAPAETPATPAPVEESIESRLRADFEKQLNERIAGVQRTYQEQINEREEMIKKLKTSSLSDEEREQLEIDEEQQYRESLETENWLLKKAGENPTAANLLQKFLEAEDRDGQWAVIAAALAAPAPAPADEPEVAVPDVDPNNPVAVVAPGTKIGSQGQVLDKGFRERYLKNLHEWPGSR